VVVAGELLTIGIGEVARGVLLVGLRGRVVGAAGAVVVGAVDCVLILATVAGVGVAAGGVACCSNVRLTDGGGDNAREGLKLN